MTGATSPRKSRVMYIAIATVGVAMAAYHFASVHFLLVDPTQHQNLHLAFALTLVFLLAAEGSRKRWQQFIWFALIGITWVAATYVHILYLVLQFRGGRPEATDIVIGIILIVVVLVATKLAYGWTFPIIGILFLTYGLVGFLLPPPFSTIRRAPGEFIFLVTTSLAEGMYGQLLGMSANYLFLFMLFSAMMQVSGATRFFLEVGKMIGRRVSGGAGLSAVVTSSMMGTVTGSVTANIVTIGAFTIPLMKKAGYMPYQAGAIEATSSTGGMIMPPIMAATAFLMAAWTGIPYVKIAAMAAIPAILYYFSAGLYVQFQAMKLNIKPMPEPTDYREMALTAPLFLIPLGVILVLLIKLFSLAYVVFWAIVATILLGLIRKKTRPSLRQWVDAMVDGAKTGAQLAAVLACLGLAAAIMIHTGLAIKLPAMVDTWSGGNFSVALIITAIIGIILGLGLPGIAVYMLVALAAAPALIRLGASVAQAHFFAFYWGCIGMITPPVAIASVIAAKLAQAPFYKTAIEATKVGLAGFVVPFFFFLTPIILLHPQPPLWAAIGLIASFLSLLCFQIAICAQYLTPANQLERWLAAAVGAIMVLSVGMKNPMLFGVALVIFVVLTFRQFMRKRRMPT